MQQVSESIFFTVTYWDNRRMGNFSHFQLLTRMHHVRHQRVTPSILHYERHCRKHTKIETLLRCDHCLKTNETKNNINVNISKLHSLMLLISSFAFVDVCVPPSLLPHLGMVIRHLWHWFVAVKRELDVKQRHNQPLQYSQGNDPTKHRGGRGAESEREGKVAASLISFNVPTYTSLSGVSFGWWEFLSPTQLNRLHSDWLVWQWNSPQCTVDSIVISTMVHSLRLDIQHNSLHSNHHNKKYNHRQANRERQGRRTMKEKKKQRN